MPAADRDPAVIAKREEFLARPTLSGMSKTNYWKQV
jgi:hypothetical protein